MPVVRELINRISFKVNPGDVKNAEKAFSGIQSKGKSVLGFFGGIAGGIKSATKALGLFTIAATKIFVDFEKDTGASKFFSKNREEAEALLKIVDEIALKSETTSRREARQASQTLSQLNISKKALESFIPFIEKISIAQPKLDFTQVAESLNKVIKGGDLQELINLVPGIKQELELLSKTTFGKPFGDILEKNRAQLVLQALQKNQGRLDELVKEQQQTLNNAFVRVAKDASDFTLTFGEKTSPAIKEALSGIESLFEELNESRALWTTIDSAVTGITTIIRESTQFIKDSDKFLKNIFEASPEAKEAFKGRRKENQRLIVGDELAPLSREQLIQGQSQRGGSQSGSDIVVEKIVGAIKQGLTPNLERATQTINVVHSGNIESSNSELRQALNGIISENSGLAPVTQ